MVTCARYRGVPIINTCILTFFCNVIFSYNEIINATIRFMHNTFIGLRANEIYI